MMKNKVETKTSVWWDIDSCPVPVGYDACRVGPCIKSALEKLGCSGPITISAMGNLKHTPHHVLRALSSSGIVIKHVPSGRRNISTYLLNWTIVNPPPANIMFISDSLCVECLSRTLSWLQTSGFNILLAYEDTPAPKQASDLVTCAEWPWKTLLKGETIRQPLQEKCSETGESACFFCTICFDHTRKEIFACQTLEDFTTHLWGKEHQLSEFRRKVRNLTMDKEYLEMMAGVDFSHPTTMVKSLSKRKLKNKVVKSGVDSSHLMKKKKKSNKRRKKFNRRRTE